MTIRELLNHIVESGAGMEDLVRIDFDGKSLPIHCDRGSHYPFSHVDPHEEAEDGDDYVDNLWVLTLHAYERVC